MGKGFLNLGRKLKFATKKKEVVIFKKGESERYKILAAEIGKLLRPSPLSFDVDEQIAQMNSNGEVYLYDFLQEAGVFTIPQQGGWNDPIMALGVQGGEITGPVAIDSEQLAKTEARVYKPIEVFSELERVPTKIDLDDLDDKIAVMRMKKDCIKNNIYAKKEVIDMVVRFENRKKYGEYKKFFEQFDTTSTEKINALVSKYKLVLKSSDLFVPTFPKDATLIMGEFIKNTKALCAKKPVFYVIAEMKDFHEQSKRNDPILLAQSPFGIYWYILGAWDKEILLLEEL